MRNLTERQVRWLLGGVGAGSYVLLMLLEVLSNYGEMTFVDFVGDSLSMLLLIAAAVGTALLAQRVNIQHEERLALIKDLEIARAEGESWRAKVQGHLNGIKTELDRQFQHWGMTAAERDVGLLILKGLSHKEIASLRTTSEATVRQQAQAIYRKADLPGKTAFSAYFLEDLLATDAVAPPTAEPPKLVHTTARAVEARTGT